MERKIMDKMHKYKKFFNESTPFFVLYFQQAHIPGFSYFGLSFLLLIEKCFWLILITSTFCVTIQLSWKSLYRYQYRNTVLTIERDHYYWNTTLPSLTICSMMNRIDEQLFDRYCKDRNIVGTAKDEFHEFVESLANASYDSFHLIRHYDSVDQLQIDPKDYMMLIYNLTEDKSRIGEGEQVVKAVWNSDFIRVDQVVTEKGICYTANNYLAPNLSAKYMLTGVKPQDSSKFPIDHGGYYHDIFLSNEFDSVKGFSLLGFKDAITIYVHSPFETINIAKFKYISTYSYRFECSAIETIPDSKLKRDTKISQRNCRFNDESNLKHFSVYTQNLCRQECRLELVYQLCSCIPHFYPNNISKAKPVCSWKQLKECVAPHEEFLIRFRKKEHGKTVYFNCECIQNCVDSDILVMQTELLEDGLGLLGSIGGDLIIREYPLVRYKRKILFSLIDLFISIGGTASFFTGFCILSIIEMIYFFTIRMFWHLMGRRIEPVERVAVESKKWEEINQIN